MKTMDKEAVVSNYNNIIEYNVVRRVPEFKLTNSAKIVYAYKGSIMNEKCKSFIDNAIRQALDVIGIREVTDLQKLRNEVGNYKKGIFHIQYEPNADEVKYSLQNCCQTI